MKGKINQIHIQKKTLRAKIACQFAFGEQTCIEQIEGSFQYKQMHYKILHR